jgi:hypothetical protein
MTQKNLGASGQSNKILLQCSCTPRCLFLKSNKILQITRTSSRSWSSSPWAKKNSQAQAHAQAQAQDAGARTGTGETWIQVSSKVIIYDESRPMPAASPASSKVIIYYSELPEAQPAAVVEVIKYDHFF